MENLLKAYEDVLLYRKIGSGKSRDVYLNNLDTQFVVKIAHDSIYGITQNCIEYYIWEYAKHSELKKWLAPCCCISDNGRILIQSRTYPCSKKEFEEFKTRKIPSCFNDLFEGNIGWFNNRIVFHDYGFVKIDTTDVKYED